jgi:hypothetical protein
VPNACWASPNRCSADRSAATAAARCSSVRSLLRSHLGERVGGPGAGGLLVGERLRGHLLGILQALVRRLGLGAGGLHDDDDGDGRDQPGEQPRPDRRDPGRVPPHPPGDAVGERVGVGRDRLVGEPPVDVGGEVLGRRVPRRRGRGHRLHADRLQRRRDAGGDGGRAGVVDPLRELNGVGRVPAAVWWPAGEEVVEDGAEPEDVRRRAGVRVADGLLGRHERRRADRPPGGGPLVRVGRVGAVRLARLRGRRRRLADHLRQPPVHDERLAERADHDVRRLQVAVDDPLRVRVADRLADGGEALQQLPQGDPPGVAGRRRVRGPAVGAGLAVEPVDDLAERRPGDEPHGVARPPVAVGDEAEDGDHAGVVEPGGDPGLGDELFPPPGVVGVGHLHPLERDLAVELGVAGAEHLAEPALRVEPAEDVPVDPRAGRGGEVRPAGRGGGGAGRVVAIGRGRRRGEGEGGGGGAGFVERRERRRGFELGRGAVAGHGRDGEDRGRRDDRHVFIGAEGHERGVDRVRVGIARERHRGVHRRGACR